jgi:sugar phosphate isomerase/epimerase
MNLGLKISADPLRFDDVLQTHPDFTEVWFHQNNKNQYTELFTKLKKYAPASGLHFWGFLSDGSLATLSYPNSTVINQSILLIKDTIDIAAANKFTYVNIHPGPRSLVTMDFTTQKWTVKTKPYTIAQAEPVFLESASILSSYAKERGVLLTVETVPVRSTNGWLTETSPHTPINLFELPIQSLHKAATLGIAIANDFVHTAATRITNDDHMLWNHVKTNTARLAPYTKLIHIGFAIKPFTGTDCHDSLENPKFETSDTLPNKMQTIELLTLFINRPDVNALVEPRDNHVNNFLLAKDLLTQAGVYHQ